MVSITRMKLIECGVRLDHSIRVMRVLAQMEIAISTTHGTVIWSRLCIKIITDFKKTFLSILEGGASNSSCSDTYMGPHPFSEKETRAIADFMGIIRSRVELYLSFHSYSQLLMYPYGHTTEEFDNFEDADEIAHRAAEGLASVFGTEYEVGNAQEVLCKY